MTLSRMTTCAAFDAKDEARIVNLTARANGSPTKALQLAHAMAEKITDVEKALRRGSAAFALADYEIGAVFFFRAGQLSA